MVQETILQHPILIRFAYPFFLIFFIVFALLEKTKLLGENKQINALVAFIVGLIVVAVAYPVEVIGNMILFLSVALIVLFVVLLLWGFIMGGEANLSGGKEWVKYVAGLVILVVSLLALVWATGIGGGVGGFFDIIFGQSWSESFWTNAIFVVLVGIALALVLRSKK